MSKCLWVYQAMFGLILHINTDQKAIFLSWPRSVWPPLSPVEMYWVTPASWSNYNLGGMLLHSTVDVYVYRMCAWVSMFQRDCGYLCFSFFSVCTCTDFQSNTDPCLPAFFCMKMYREVYVCLFFKVSHLQSHCTCWYWCWTKPLFIAGLFSLSVL